MVRLFTAAQMRLADRLAVEAGVPGLELMENAGRAVADVAAALAGEAAGQRGAWEASLRRPGPVVVLAGKGNNGGDGLVAARYLAERGFPIEVVLAEPAAAFGGDALVNLNAFIDRGLGCPVVFRPDGEGAGGDAGRAAGQPDEREAGQPAGGAGRALGPAELLELLSRASVVIDALLGTGAKGAPREPVATLIRVLGQVASLGRPRPLVLAVDLPSGLDADTGLAAGPCVRADATVTLGGVKLGLSAPAAAEVVGRLYLAPIGLPGACLERALGAPGTGLTAPGTGLAAPREESAAPREESAAPGERAAAPEMRPAGPEAVRTPPALHWLLPREAADLLPARPVNGHKGTFGHVWIVAGSPGFTGAAVLSGLGALRAGAGLATVLCPEGSRPAIASGLPELLTRGLPEGPDGRLAAAAWAELAPVLAQSPGHAGGRAALVVGPGLGATPEVAAFVADLVRDRERHLPAVLDADALNAIALDGPDGVTRLLRAAGPGPLVLTPHPGEMARLTGLTVARIQSERLETALGASAAWGVVVALKGAGTVVATPDGSAWVNATGNPGLATAGSGDVLAGAIGALLAQGLGPREAALLGVAAHGLAGDLAAAELGSRGLLASDFAHRLPRAMDSLKDADYGPAPVPNR